jgi:hypothetical protein
MKHLGDAYLEEGEERGEKFAPVLWVNLEGFYGVGCRVEGCRWRDEG